jgi:hypothetical protein
MPTPSGIRESLLKNLLRQKIECAVCGRRYRADKLRFIGHKDELWVFMAVCTRCRTAAFIGVTLQAGQPLARDMSLAEWEHFQGQPPVSVDDVLDLHDLLKNFDGDFAAVFSD